MAMSVTVTTMFHCLLRHTGQSRVNDQVVKRLLVYL